MEFPWISADFPLISIDFPWIFDGLPRILQGFPRNSMDFHGFSMDFLGFSLDSPLIFHGVRRYGHALSSHNPMAAFLCKASYHDLRTLTQHFLFLSCQKRPWPTKRPKLQKYNKGQYKKLLVFWRFKFQILEWIGGRVDCGLLDGWTYGVNEHMPNTLFYKVPASRRCKKGSSSVRSQPVGGARQQSEHAPLRICQMANASATPLLGSRFLPQNTFKK